MIPKASELIPKLDLHSGHSNKPNKLSRVLDPSNSETNHAIMHSSQSSAREIIPDIESQIKQLRSINSKFVIPEIESPASSLLQSEGIDSSTNLIRNPQLMKPIL